MEKELELLVDLYNRLVLDYSGDQKFEQHEEDRLIIRNIIDDIENNEVN